MIEHGNVQEMRRLDGGRDDSTLIMAEAVAFAVDLVTHCRV